MNIQVFMDGYGSSCTSMKSMGFMRVYGGFRESTDTYEYAGIDGYSWEIMVV